MTCKQRDKVFDQVSDPQHLSACEDCTEAEQILAHSRSLLVQSRAQMPVHTRVELRQQLDLELEKSQNRRRFWLPALAGSTAVALLTFAGLKALDSSSTSAAHRPMVVRTRQPLPLDRPLKLQKAEEIRFGASSIQLVEQSALKLRRPQPSWTELKLNTGAAQLNVRPFAQNERFTLLTPAGLIELTDAEFRVDVVATRTSLAVKRGTLRIHPKAQAQKPTLELKKGQSITLEHTQTASLDHKKPTAEPPEVEHPQTRDRPDPISRRLRKIAARSKRKVSPRIARAEVSPKSKPVPSPKTAPRRARPADTEPPSDTPKIPAPQRTESKERTERAKRMERMEQTERTERADPSASPAREEPSVKPAGPRTSPPLIPQVQPTTPKPMDAFALMQQADKLRREGKLEDAATLYGHIAKRPSVLAEEALYQQAQLLKKLRRNRSARALLQQAQHRYPQGSLQKERAALLVRLMLEAGQTDEAATLLTRSGNSLELHSLRLKTAQRLVSTAPQRALSLIGAVLDSNAPERLLVQARSLEDRAQKLLQKK